MHQFLYIYIANMPGQFHTSQYFGHALFHIQGAFIYHNWRFKVNIRTILQSLFYCKILYEYWHMHAYEDTYLTVLASPTVQHPAWSPSLIPSAVSSTFTIASTGLTSSLIAFNHTMYGYGRAYNEINSCLIIKTWYKFGKLLTNMYRILVINIL